jgi:hypothetical protein
MLGSVVTKWRDDLEAEEVVQVEELRSDDFFRRLKELPMLIELNKDLREFSVATAFSEPRDVYPQFIERVRVLVRRLPPRTR